MSEEVLKVELTTEEKNEVSGIKEEIEQQELALGLLRVKYLKGEAQLLQLIAKSENKYIEYLNTLAKEKGLDTEQHSWQFEPEQGVFTRR